jgi:hypothetical protein
VALMFLTTCVSRRFEQTSCIDEGGLFENVFRVSYTPVGFAPLAT